MSLMTRKQNCSLGMGSDGGAELRSLLFKWDWNSLQDLLTSRQETGLCFGQEEEQQMPREKWVGTAWWCH